MRSPQDSSSRTEAPPDHCQTQPPSVYEDIICFGPDSTLLKDLGQCDRKRVEAAGRFYEFGQKPLYSAATLYQHPRNEHVPEIVVLGASNVGKSSFLNALIGRGDLARVSRNPGKTTTMNVYGIGPRSRIPQDHLLVGEKEPDHGLRIVDTPGYGFQSQQEWGEALLNYIEKRTMLCGAVLLISSDKKVQDTDRWILRALADSNRRTMVILTKIDKIGPNWLEKCAKITKDLRKTMRRSSVTSQIGSTQDLRWQSGVLATAARLCTNQRLANAGGMGGARLALLDMAGFNADQRVEPKPNTARYGGTIVSFDDVRWKSR